MDLRDIVETYGWNDYYDMCSGRTFHLSEAEKHSENEYSVPVTEGDKFIGYAKLEMR